MSAPPIRLAVVGLGKIARDQHLPAIAGDPSFVLAATVSRASGEEGTPSFRRLEDLLDEAPAFDAVAICTPPQVRHRLAHLALSRGKHVLLEKPPAATLGEIEDLRRFVQEGGPTVFAAWHSRFAPAVAPALAWLQARRVSAVRADWKEDIRVWHPGQDWIWEPAGLGVFDPGINAFSILSALLPPPLRLVRAELSMPSNRQAPAASTLELSDATGAPILAALDFLHPGPPCWDIALETDQGRLTLSQGGARWAIDGVAQPVGLQSEYPALYQRFAALIEAGESDLDAAPLRLVADAFLLGRRTATAPFSWS